MFWYIGKWGTQPPRNWWLEYLSDDQKTWKRVHNASEYGVAPDRFNEARFDKVNTTAVRIKLTLNGEKSSGVHEVYVR